MTISIIVPVLNEIALIRPFLRHLRARAGEAEVIVVDGGSVDGTAAEAAVLCNHLVQSSRGRSIQMNTGASVARGETLWFLHVDVTVPPECLEQIEKTLKDPGVVGGFFRIRIPDSRLIYRLTDGFAHYAGLLLGLRYSDHGLFCRREIFEKVGGFPEVPLMEDADFYRQLLQEGKTVVIPDRILVDPRRFKSVGPVRLTLVFGLISLLYLFRAPRNFLRSIYRRACC